jgi:hypothetical protein
LVKFSEWFFSQRIGALVSAKRNSVMLIITKTAEPVCRKTSTAIYTRKKDM